MGYYDFKASYVFFILDLGFWGLYFIIFFRLRFVRIVIWYFFIIFLVSNVLVMWVVFV